MNKIIVPVFALTLFSCGGSTNQTEKKDDAKNETTSCDCYAKYMDVYKSETDSLKIIEAIGKINSEFNCNELNFKAMEGKDQNQYAQECTSFKEYLDYQLSKMK
jgi:hypothetical protein